MKKLFPWIVVLIAMTGTEAVSALGEKEIGALDDDERLIESAGLSCDGPGLLDFFRARSSTEPEAGRIDDLLRRFSGPSVESRIQAGAELVALGPLATPGLRRVINDFEAPEVRERARRCLAWTEGSPSASLAAAAARVVGRRKPAGAAEALLAYLPFADNEEVSREVTAALQAVGVAGGRVDPVLVRALSDPVPLRRAAAAAVLSQAAPAEQKQAAEKLLHDANPEVRMTVAMALARANNAAAFPVLIDLLAVLPVNKRMQVEEVLQEWAGEWAPAGGPASEDEIARRIRRDAWAAWWANTEGPALLAMLDKRTLSPGEQKKVMAAIRRLGANDFTAREKAAVELIARGRMILPILRESLKNNEAELVRRAQGCIERIENEPAHRLPAAALRLLALRNPPSAAESLLAYLPFAEDENLGEAQSAMARLALRDGKPEAALVRALADTKPMLRAAAGEALAQGGGPEARPAVRKLLDDADLTVRLRVAKALVSRDAEAVPVLIGLIANLPDEQAGQVHDFLTPLAGEQAPRAPEDNAESRKKSSADWAAWWKVNAAKADLTRLANPHQHLLGFTVICEINAGKIVELGRDRKPRWSFAGLAGPVDALVLPNNRVVVAENHASRVSERDLTGKIVWQRQVNGNPHNLQRLPNGHILVATNLQIVEVDRTGKEVFTLNNLQPQFGQLTGAYKSRNGHYICMTQNGKCVHYDAKGKELKSFHANRNNAWMDLLPNGRILLAQNGSNKAGEYDSDGKLLLDLDAPQVTVATGLPNGNFLIASHSTGRVMEMDRKGKVLWEYRTQGPWRARGR
jgi:HEAT repeat protein